MKRILSILLAVLNLAVFVSCQNDPVSETAAETAAETEADNGSGEDAALFRLSDEDLYDKLLG